MKIQKRERSANFIAAETQLLVSIVSEFKHIVESKKTDAVTNKKKESAWNSIEQSFNSCGISPSPRTWKTLKLKYEGLKKRKKFSLQRQNKYKGGGSSNAPDFDDVEDKVLSIDLNNDSDGIKTEPVEVEERSIPENIKTETTDPHGTYIMPDLAMLLEIEETQKDKWNSKVLNTRVPNVLKSKKTRKPSVTSKLNSAHLKLVQLQKEIAEKEHRFVEEEHKLKMLHLANEERRKEELHAQLLQRIRSGVVSNDMML